MPTSFSCLTCLGHSKADRAGFARSIGIRQCVPRERVRTFDAPIRLPRVAEVLRAPSRGADEASPGRTPQVHCQSNARPIRGKLTQLRDWPPLIVSLLELCCSICSRAWNRSRSLSHDLQAPWSDVEHVTPQICLQRLREGSRHRRS